MALGRLARNGSVAVDTSVVEVSDMKNRQSFSIMNTGLTTISLFLSDTEGAVAGSGIVLLPNSSLTDSDGGGYECWKGQITAIGSGAGGTLAIMERIYNPQIGR